MTKARHSPSSCFPSSSWMSRRSVSREADSPWEEGGGVINVPGTPSATKSPGVHETKGASSSRMQHHPILYSAWTPYSPGPLQPVPPAPFCMGHSPAPEVWPRVSPGKRPGNLQDQLTAHQRLHEFVSSLSDQQATWPPWRSGSVVPALVSVAHTGVPCSPGAWLTEAECVSQRRAVGPRGPGSDM